MDCVACEQEFDDTISPHKGKRKYCYDCVPLGLTRNQHSIKIGAARVQMARRDKLKRGCDVCGYDRCSSALEWHHPDDNKEGQPAILARTSWKRYQEEIENCLLLCANCHREVHYDLDGPLPNY